MKPYLLFQCDAYYPDGGWCDFKGAFAELAEAVAEGERLCGVKLSTHDAWFHVAKADEGIVYDEEGQR
jgi:hypothetical protein